MSETSEELVFEMCKDIKALDTAKNNLTFSMKSLTNFINILTTLEQLRKYCIDREYKYICQSLSVFEDIMEFFKKYERIKQIQVITSTLHPKTLTPLRSSSRTRTSSSPS